MENRKKTGEFLKKIGDIYPDALKIPTLVDVVVNKECNLRCRHCDWPDNFKSANKELTAKEWASFVRSFAKTSKKNKTVAIAGREPFLTSESRKKVATIIETAKKKGTYVGVVNNGHFVKNFIDEYPKVKMDYFDVSMEGPKEINDAVRGKGSFERASRGLMLGIKHKIAKKIFISLTLNNLNLPVLENFVKKAKKWGVENFVFHSLVPGKYVDEKLRWKDEDFLNFIPVLERISKKLEGALIVDLYPDSFDDFKNVIDTLLPSMDLFLDQNNYLLGEWKKGGKLYFRFINVLSSLLNFFVVTPEGFIVTPLGMRTECYAKNKLANVKKIKDWKENPNKKAIIKLIKDQAFDYDPKYFPFLLK